MPETPRAENPAIRQAYSERMTFVNEQYDLDDPEWPLPEWGMGRFDAEELVEWALDKAGVPKRDDNGGELQWWFRCRWLRGACEEARGA